MLQRLGLVVLFLVVAGLVSAATGDGLRSSVSTDQVNSSESSCPDPGDDGRPCVPACPCTCCPGHSPAAAFMPVRPALVPVGPASEGPPSVELGASLPDVLHSKDVLYRIYHPPRA